MRRTLPFVALLGLLATFTSCDSDSSPTQPQGPLNVSGTWTGTQTIVTTTPSGNCVADKLQATNPFVLAASWTIGQSGTTLLVDTAFGRFTGTLSGSTITLSGVPGNACGGGRCNNGSLYSVCPLAFSATGTVSGNRFTGNWTDQNRTFNAAGAAMGDITNQGTFDLTR